MGRVPALADDDPHLNALFQVRSGLRALRDDSAELDLLRVRLSEGERAVRRQDLPYRDHQPRARHLRDDARPRRYGWWRGGGRGRRRRGGGGGWRRWRRLRRRRELDDDGRNDRDAP